MPSCVFVSVKALDKVHPKTVLMGLRMAISCSLTLFRWNRANKFAVYKCRKGPYKPRYKRQKYIVKQHCSKTSFITVIKTVSTLLTMKLLGLPALALYATSVYAADCFGQGQTSLLSDYFADAYWDARGKMCGNTDCGYQKDCTTTSTKTVSMGLGEPVTVRVSFKRQKLNGNGFKDCWVCYLSCIKVHANSRIGCD